MDDNEIAFFAPWRLVAEFSDGARLTFDGLTETQAYDAMVAVCDEHGDLGWYDGVTDVNYEKGQYYKTLPRPPCVDIVDFSGYDGPLDKNGFPPGLLDEITQNRIDDGRDPDEPQIILKRNAPPDNEKPNETQKRSM